MLLSYYSMTVTLACQAPAQAPERQGRMRASGPCGDFPAVTSACRLVHRRLRIVTATERVRQELIEILIRVPAQLRTGECLLGDAVRLTVVWRSLLEDGAKLLEQRVPAGGDRGDIDQLVLHFGQEPAILLTEDPQPCRTGAVPIDARRWIEGDVHCQRREGDCGQHRRRDLDAVAPESECQQVRGSADPEQAQSGNLGIPGPLR